MSKAPPYRAEHVGSLPRPVRLLKARETWRAGTLPKEELTRLEDECIRDAVAMQENVGLQTAAAQCFRGLACDGKIVRLVGSNVVPLAQKFGDDILDARYIAGRLRGNRDVIQLG